MTGHIQVTGTVPRIRYVANGSTTVFAFSFAIFETENLAVYLGSTLQTSDAYTVSIAENSAGGSMTFATAPTAGTIVTLSRKLIVKRTSDFQEGSTLRAKVLNDELDYQTACIQEVADNLNRSMVLPPYAVGTDVNLTLPTPAAGKAIVWNSDGTNLENSTVCVNALESTIAGYKTSAEAAATTATAKASEATTAATMASTAATNAGTAATNAANATATKANINMDNLTATGKGRTISLSIPDYATGIVLSSATLISGYTVPSNGVITGIMKKANEANTAKYITVNNKTVCALPYDYSGSQISMYFVVGTGDVVKANCSASNLDGLLFSNFKGA